MGRLAVRARIFLIFKISLANKSERQKSSDKVHSLLHLVTAAQSVIEL